MPQASASALITDRGQRVLLRLQGRFYNLSHQELRGLLGLPEGAPGLGISIEGDTLRFEFPADQQTIEMTAGQWSRRLAKQMTSGTEATVSPSRRAGSPLRTARR